MVTSDTAFATITTDRTTTDAERAGFDALGFAKLRDAVDPEQLRYFGPLISELVIRLNTQHLPIAERDTYGKAFIQYTNLWAAHDDVRPFSLASRFARIAAELMGVPAVRIYHDQALYKEPHGGITPWHYDQYYWPFESDRCCTLWILLSISMIEGSSRTSSSLHCWPALSSAVIHRREPSLPAKILMKCGRGIRALSTHRLVISRS